MDAEELKAQMAEIEARAEQFASVFAPDAIEAALAAVDEALFIEGTTDPMYRGRMKRAALKKIGQSFLHKAAGANV